MQPIGDTENSVLKTMKNKNEFNEYTLSKHTEYLRLQVSKIIFGGNFEDGSSTWWFIAVGLHGGNKASGTDWRNDILLSKVGFQGCCILVILTIIEYPIWSIQDDCSDQDAPHIFLECLTEARLRLGVVIVLETVITEGVTITNSDTVFPKDFILENKDLVISQFDKTRYLMALPRRASSNSLVRNNANQSMAVTTSTW